MPAKIKNFQNFVNESDVRGRTITSVDIQPEYTDNIDFSIYEWVEFIKDSFRDNRLVFLYNGPELGMIDMGNYKAWLYDHGMPERVFNNAWFIDKAYGFFRYCMDMGTDEKVIVELVRFMYEEEINDSRDMTEDDWDRYVEQTGSSGLRAFLEDSGDPITIPDFMRKMERFDDITLCGGGRNECLREVELALRALEKPYRMLSQFVY